MRPVEPQNDHKGQNVPEVKKEKCDEVSWYYGINSTGDYVNAQLGDDHVAAPDMSIWSPFVRGLFAISSRFMSEDFKKEIHESLGRVRSAGSSLAFAAEVVDMAGAGHQSSVAQGAEMLGIGIFFAAVIIPKMQKLEENFKSRIELNKKLLARQRQGLQIPSDLNKDELLKWLKKPEQNAPVAEDKMRKIILSDFSLYTSSEEMLLTFLRILYEILNTALCMPGVAKNDFSLSNGIPNPSWVSKVTGWLDWLKKFKPLSIVIDAVLGVPLFVGHLRIAKYKTDDILLELRKSYVEGELQTRWQEHPDSKEVKDDAPSLSLPSRPSARIPAPVPTQESLLLKLKHVKEEIENKKLECEDMQKKISKKDKYSDTIEERTKRTRVQEEITELEHKKNEIETLRNVQEEVEACDAELVKQRDPVLARTMKLTEATVKGIWEGKGATSLVFGVSVGVLELLVLTGVLAASILPGVGWAVLGATLTFCAYRAYTARQKAAQQLAKELAGLNAQSVITHHPSEPSATAKLPVIPTAEPIPQMAAIPAIPAIPVAVNS
jgi:hypothetical protein